MVNVTPGCVDCFSVTLHWLPSSPFLVRVPIESPPDPDSDGIRIANECHLVPIGLHEVQAVVWIEFCSMHKWLVQNTAPLLTLCWFQNGGQHSTRAIANAWIAFPLLPNGVTNCLDVRINALIVDDWIDWALRSHRCALAIVRRRSQLLRVHIFNRLFDEWALIVGIDLMTASMSMDLVASRSNPEINQVSLSSISPL